MDDLAFERMVLSVPPWPPEIARLRELLFSDPSPYDSLFPDEDRIIVARADGTAVAYIAAGEGIDQGSCYLHELVVAPAFRRQGIGRRLVLEAAKWLLGEGFLTVFLYPLEDADFARRASWFEGMGFREPDPLTTHCIGLAELIANLGPSTQTGPG